MKFKITTVLACALVLISSNLLAEIPSKDLVSMTCPPVSALLHPAPGKPWIIDRKIVSEDWYVVQTPEAVNSKLTSFQGLVGGLSVYFTDRKYQSPLEVTCRYESGDDVVYVKSSAIYSPYSLTMNAKEYPDHYTSHKATVTECAKGFTHGEFSPELAHVCEWQAYLPK